AGDRCGLLRGLARSHRDYTGFRGCAVPVGAGGRAKQATRIEIRCGSCPPGASGGRPAAPGRSRRAGWPAGFPRPPG
ncbi:MAG: hypothetical protein E6Q70_09940, partial [Pseudomonas monteilii]